MSSSTLWHSNLISSPAMVLFLRPRQILHLPSDNLPYPHDDFASACASAKLLWHLLAAESLHPSVHSGWLSRKPCSQLLPPARLTFMPPDDIRISPEVTQRLFWRGCCVSRPGGVHSCTWYTALVAVSFPAADHLPSLKGGTPPRIIVVGSIPRLDYGALFFLVDADNVKSIDEASLKDWDVKYAMIVDTIKPKLMSITIKVKPTSAFLHFEKLWNVDLNIQKSHSGNKD
ncbi:hypothetical protein Tco_1018979 [Tanacetum coccineum]|uniref:Uncharacterized protein n=1 Tax=Tanacetum coccineum TaxID=301880 RepID=A0ABQ5FWC5_9ASTR